eukprot:jgi/Antlo1/178/279
MDNGIGSDTVHLNARTFEFRDAVPSGDASCTEDTILDGRPCVSGPQEEDSGAHSCVYFEEVHRDLRHERISAYSTGIAAKLMAVIDNLMAVYTGSEIVVYHWDDTLRFRKTRTMKGSLLQFLVETGNVDESAALALMQILLFLVRSGIRRCEQVLEQAMARLGVERALHMWISGRELHCSYRNLVTCVYDSRLVLLRQHLSEDVNISSASASVVCGDVAISANGPYIVIDRGRSFVERVRMCDVKQLTPVANNLFVLASGSINVLRFTAGERVLSEDSHRCAQAHAVPPMDGA